MRWRYDSLTLQSSFHVVIQNPFESLNEEIELRSKIYIYWLLT